MAVSSRVLGSEEALMRYKPKSIAALHIALGSLPDRMHVKRTQTSECLRRPLANFGS